MVQKRVKKSLEQKKKKRTEELRTFEIMSFFYSDQESISSSSSKESKVRKIGFGEEFNLNFNHDTKHKNNTKNDFLNLDRCINASYKYESFCPCLLSNLNFNGKNKIF